MRRPLLLRETWPLFGIFVFLHTSDVIFALIGEHWNVLWIVVGAGVVHTLLLLIIYGIGRRKASTALSEEASGSLALARGGSE